MPGRLGPRFALEAGFLIMLAVAMGLADLSAVAIVVVMAVAWLLVAIVEWIASRESRYPVQTPWQPAAQSRRLPPEWGENENTEFIAPGVDDTETPAEPVKLPLAAETPRRRWWRRNVGP